MGLTNRNNNCNTLRITLTANAGVILQAQDSTVLIDALHNERTREFSPVSEDEVCRIREFFKGRHPDMVLVTHRHPDHYSEPLTRMFEREWPDTLFLTAEDFPDTRLQSRLKEIRFTSMAIPHEGNGFEHVIQRGYCITMSGMTVLHVGDAALDSVEKIERLIKGKKIDAAIMNFPWITLSSGRAFLEKKLKPSHLVIVHIPFEGEDPEGYREAVFKAAGNLNLPDVRVMGEPMQMEVIRKESDE